MPWIAHMLFVDLNDNFSCQEFDRLLCKCSVKGCRENTMWKTTCLVPSRSLRLAWTRPSICISETLHMPRLIMTFHLFRCFYPPLGKKRWSGAERSPCLYRSSKCGWWRLSFASRAAKSCSSQSGLTQNLTLSKFFAKYIYIFWMKYYNLNQQTTYVQSRAYKDWDQKIITFSPFKLVLLLSTKIISFLCMKN